MVWHFIGVYMIKTTLHGRLEMRNFSSRREMSYLRAPMTMDLVVPQLKNRQIEIEHGCLNYKPLADDCPTSRRPTCEVDMSKRT